VMGTAIMYRRITRWGYLPRGPDPPPPRAIRADNPVRHPRQFRRPQGGIPRKGPLSPGPAGIWLCSFSLNSQHANPEPQRTDDVLLSALRRSTPSLSRQRPACGPSSVSGSIICPSHAVHQDQGGHRTWSASSTPGPCNRPSPARSTAEHDSLVIAVPAAAGAWK